MLTTKLCLNTVNTLLNSVLCFSTTKLSTFRRFTLYSTQNLLEGRPAAACPRSRPNIFYHTPVLKIYTLSHSYSCFFCLLPFLLLERNDYKIGFRMEDRRREILVLLDGALGRLAITSSVRSWDELRLVFANTYTLMYVRLALYIRIHPAIFDLCLSRYIFRPAVCEELLKLTVEYILCGCASSGCTPWGCGQWLKLIFRADVGTPYILFFPKTFVAF